MHKLTPDQLNQLRECQTKIENSLNVFGFNSQPDPTTEALIEIAAQNKMIAEILAAVAQSA